MPRDAINLLVMVLHDCPLHDSVVDCMAIEPSAPAGPMHSLPCLWTTKEQYAFVTHTALSSHNSLHSFRHIFCPIAHCSKLLGDQLP